MRRKFSFDVGKLKIGSSREFYREHLTSPDSRPSTPKSVRPPLPQSIDAELRAACTYIVTHPKPSHEIWGGQSARPALDYAAIKAGGEPSQPPAQKPSIRTKVEEKHDTIAEVSKSNCKPIVRTDELFKQGESENRPQPQTNARSRADQLMASANSVKSVVDEVNARERSQVLISPHQQHQQQPAPLLPPVSKSDHAERARTSTRSDSVGTTGSSPHTDTTDYPWSTSTPLTSAAITPAWSKRASSQNVTVTAESGNAPRVDVANAEWMRSELEKHKRAILERERKELLDHAAQHIEATSTLLTTQTATPVTRVPARKPVPSKSGVLQTRDASRPQTRSRTTQDEAQKLNHASTHISQSKAERGRTGADQDSLDTGCRGRGRSLERSTSRLGRASRAASRAASKAAVRAGSITNDILGHYFLPRSAQPKSPTSPPIIITAQQSESQPRSPGRTHHIPEQMRGCIRSVSHSGNGRPYVDTSQSHRRVGSSDSVRSIWSKTAPQQHESKWKAWRGVSKRSVNVTSPAMSIPGSSSSVSQAETGQEQGPLAVQPRVKPLDLNRELPPLPGLDQWKAKEMEQQESNVQPSTTRTTPAGIAYQGIKRVWSRRDVASRSPVPTLSSKEEPVCVRMKSTTASRSAQHAADVKRTDSAILAPVHNSLPDTNARSPNLITLAAAQHQSSLTRSTEHSPRLLHDEEQNQGRLRSPNSSTSYYNDQSDVSRNTPIFDQLSSRVTTDNHAHSRNDSDQINFSRKPSIEEYSRLYDARYQNTVAITARTDSSVAAKEKMKWKWWHGKERRHWMDQVVESGARNGMLLTDGVAGAPIVRY